MKRTGKTVFDRPVHRKPPPAPVPPPFALAVQLLHRGDLEQSKTILDGILRSHPGHADAWHLRGLIAIMGGDPQRGAEFIGTAIALQPGNANFHFNRGNAFKNLGQMQAAVGSYDEAIRLQPDHAAACCNRGIALHALRRFDDALASYDRALRLDPRDTDCHFNRGLTIHALGRLNDAVAAFDRAIELRPDFAEAYCWRGHAFRDGKRWDAAVASYTRAIEIKPDLVEAYGSRGNVLLVQDRLGAAVADYKRAAALKPDGFMFGDLLLKRAFLCDWADFDASLTQLKSEIERGSLVVSPFAALGLVDSPALQMAVAQNWSRVHHPAGTMLGIPPRRESHEEKIRLGYYSADFHDHATCHLMADQFELHDRSRFELIAFSFGPEANDEMRQRVVRCFDAFIDVRALSDLDIARKSRDLGIDIAVDLKGHVDDGRPGIFAPRCAPVQVNFLGYPGTMGADYMDYIVGDRTIIPQESRRFYTEKIAYLPDTYQPNDRQRPLPHESVARESLGLPPNAFVFCCFNDPYKISPMVFDRWMNVLKAVDRSVLWLFSVRDETADNLRREASRRGVQQDRLVFGKRLPLREHFSRYQVADLFLDTLPYNAHTTASEALWCGLPVLTCMGEAFAARVAASLLNAIHLPEMITTNLDDYESLAVALARDPARLRQIRDKLSENRLTTPLFDTPRFTRNLEAAYLEMHRRHQQGLPPDHLFIG